eukprot:GEMP01098772.1.p1 GENE.GEMP01098772.1~~GEMP01098772.1.p1  ORF type:complete len:112 (-),score=3.07 GEMP01098772.1:63-398(-)
MLISYHRIQENTNVASTVRKQMFVSDTMENKKRTAVFFIRTKSKSTTYDYINLIQKTYKYCSLAIFALLNHPPTKTRQKTIVLEKQTKQIAIFNFRYQRKNAIIGDFTTKV